MDHCHIEVDYVRRSRGGRMIDRFGYVHGKTFGTDTTPTWDHKAEEVVCSFTLLPISAPPAWADPLALAKAVELSENRRDAQLARTLQLAIDRKIPEQLWPVFSRETLQSVVRSGRVVSGAVQNVKASDGLPNPHIHATISLRAVVDGKFARKKDRTFNLPLEVERAEWATTMMVVAARLAIGIALDPRSVKEKGGMPPEPRAQSAEEFAAIVKRREIRRAILSRSRPRLPGGPLTLRPACKERKRPLAKEQVHLDAALAKVRTRLKSVTKSFGCELSFKDEGKLRATPAEICITPSPQALRAAALLCHEVGWKLVTAHGLQDQVDPLIHELYELDRPVGVVNRAMSDAAVLAFSRKHPVDMRALEDLNASENLPVSLGQTPAAPTLDTGPPQVVSPLDDRDGAAAPSYLADLIAPMPIPTPVQRTPEQVEQSRQLLKVRDERNQRAEENVRNAMKGIQERKPAGPPNGVMRLLPRKRYSEGVG